MYFGHSMVISVTTGLPDMLSYEVSSILLIEWPVYCGLTTSGSQADSGPASICLSRVNILV